MHGLLRSRLAVVVVFGVTLLATGRRALYLGTGSPGATERGIPAGATNDNEPAGDIELSLTGLARLSYITSHFDDTRVQPRDSVER